MTRVYIGLGSNLQNPALQIQDAVIAIKLIPQSSISAISSLYCSQPMGPQDQPDYMNAVLELATDLAPEPLLDELQAIENNAGRVRKDNRWGPRILDLDIILFGDDIIDTERLTVPHYGMKNREFVLLPLAEIAPEHILPDGCKISHLADNIASNGLEIHSTLRNA